MGCLVFFLICKSKQMFKMQHYLKCFKHKQKVKQETTVRCFTGRQPNPIVTLCLFLTKFPNFVTKLTNISQTMTQTFY